MVGSAFIVGDGRCSESIPPGRFCCVDLLSRHASTCLGRVCLRTSSHCVVKSLHAVGNECTVDSKLSMR